MEGSKILIPQFDGKERHFDKWIESFEAYCHTRLCGGSLRKDECELSSKMKGSFDADEKVAILEKEAVVKNTRCMALLVMSLVNPTCRVMIHASKMKYPVWPTGLAWDVIERLKKKYKPNDEISTVELNTD